jgi:quercetin dioxygenase-like cupin family protein
MQVFKTVSSHIAFAVEKMKKVNLFDTKGMFCDVYCFESGQEQTSHTHKGSDKVYYVLQGTGLVCVGSEEKELSEGSIALAPSGYKHGVKNPGPERLVLLVFMAPKP